MEYCTFIINNVSVHIIILFIYLCALIIVNQSNFPSLLEEHLFSDDVFTGMRVGQPVTHMRLTNRKPQPKDYRNFRLMPTLN